MCAGFVREGRQGSAAGQTAGWARHAVLAGSKAAEDVLGQFWLGAAAGEVAGGFACWRGGSAEAACMTQ